MGKSPSATRLLFQKQFYRLQPWNCAPCVALGIIYRYFVAALVLLTPALLAAAEIDSSLATGNPTAMLATTPGLTLVQLTDIALQRNPKTRLVWLAIRASEAGVELARAGYWPQIDATVNAGRSRSLSAIGSPSNTQTRYGASVSLNYLLWDLGGRSSSLAQAEFELSAARLSQDQAVQDVILQIEQAYYQVLGLQAVVDVNRQSLKDSATSLAAARERRTSGLATVGDVYKAEAALAGVRLAMQQAEGQLAVAQGVLATAIGDSPERTLSLAVWDATFVAELPTQSVTSLLEDASQARPELLVAKAQEMAGAAKLSAIRASGLPNLSVAASTGRTEVNTVGQSSQFNAQLSLQIPLFAGYADRAAVHQAEAQLDIARANREDLQGQVALQVWQAYQYLRTAAAVLDSSAAQLKSAQLAAEVSTARYNSGLETILDVLTSQNTLAKARVQQVQARLDWAAARAALGHAVGGLKATASKVEIP